MSSAGSATQTRVKMKKPSTYNVIMHNDNFTPMDFVVSVLTTVFAKSTVEAQEITTYIHEKGKAIVGTYSQEVAEQKVKDVTKLASHHGYPLRTEAVPS